MEVNWPGEQTHVCDTKYLLNIQKLRSLVKLDHDVNVVVDLDAEQGRTKSKTPNVFRLVVRHTKKVNLAAVEEFLRGNASLLGDALEGLSKWH